MSGPALVVGATGGPGGKVVARGKRVRAPVRPETDPSRLTALGVEIARGISPIARRSSTSSPENYVADPRAQEELFGPAPTVEDWFRRYLTQMGLTASSP